MEQVRNGNVIVIDQQASWESAKLIRKLRWIGLNDEAHQLELALSTLPSEQRGIVSAEPYSTD